MADISRQLGHLAFKIKEGSNSASSRVLPEIHRRVALGRILGLVDSLHTYGVLIISRDYDEATILRCWAVDLVNDIPISDERMKQVDEILLALKYRELTVDPREEYEEQNSEHQPIN